MNNSSSKESEDFLRRFRRGLADLPADIREDLVTELRSHIEERLAQGKLDPSAAFGSPEAYASRFLTEEALRSAVSGTRPWQLVSVLLGKLRSTATVVFAVVPLAVIELLALAVAAVGVAKPFSPSHIGLFFYPNGSFGVLGGVSDAGAMHEVLGWTAMPIFIFGGILLFWVCHRLMLRIARGELSRVRHKK